MPCARADPRCAPHPISEVLVNRRSGVGAVETSLAPGVGEATTSAGQLQCCCPMVSECPVDPCVLITDVAGTAVSACHVGDFAELGDAGKPGDPAMSAMHERSVLCLP